MSSFPNINYLKSAKITFLEELSQEPNNYFGTLEVTSEAISKSSIHHLQLYFNIDISWSMNERCKDKQPKIHHVKTIITNLLTTLYNDFKYQKISVIINGFETHIHKILDIENLIDHNLETYITPKIAELVPLNSTNIEMALKTASQILDIDIEQANSEIEKVHILLTDGNATEGITNPFILKTFMPEKVKNVILGIGTDYDANALQIISSANSTIFKHINEAETIGLYVGEIIHAIEFKTLTDLNINIENGEIYNFETGQWSNILKVESIASEQIKTYHIRRGSSNNIKVNMNWSFNNIQLHHSVSEYTISNTIIRYKDRQDVLELLHTALEYSKGFKNTQIKEDRFSKFLYDSDLENDKNDPNTIAMIKKLKAKREENEKTILEKQNKQKEIKQNLKLLTLRLMFYMEENQLQTDLFYIRLCKDLTVAIDSIDKKNADILINSRLDSQGKQETYTCEPDVDDSDYDYYQYAQREYDNNEDDDKEDDYNKMLLKLNINTASNNKKLESPYSTLSQVRFMRGVSSTPIEYDSE
jgi:uncharacterized protein YegL